MQVRLCIIICVGCWSQWLGQLGLNATELVREEPIPIQSILANPQAFNLRAVRLQGVVQTLERIPHAGGCGPADDAYIFTLNDTTGELAIVDHGACQNEFSLPAKPLMTDFAVGDNVEVVIDVSVLFSPNFDSRKLEGKLRWVKRIPSSQVFGHP
jgi:hypothetical protein